MIDSRRRRAARGDARRGETSRHVKPRVVVVRVVRFAGRRANARSHRSYPSLRGGERWARRRWSVASPSFEYQYQYGYYQSGNNLMATHKKTRRCHHSSGRLVITVRPRGADDARDFSRAGAADHARGRDSRAPPHDGVLLCVPRPFTATRTSHPLPPFDAPLLGADDADVPVSSPPSCPRHRPDVRGRARHVRAPSGSPAAHARAAGGEARGDQAEGGPRRPRDGLPRLSRVCPERLRSRGPRGPLRAGGRQAGGGVQRRGYFSQGARALRSPRRRPGVQAAVR